MIWVESIGVLVVVALVTRRLLGLSKNGPKSGSSLADESIPVSRTITLELEAQSAILAVSLNEAMEERASGEPELAWSTLHLMTTAQWMRQAETLGLLLQAVIRHLPLASFSPRARRLVPEFFKSDVMRGYLALHDSADQFVFRSKPRLTLHLRALDQAVAQLTADFLDAQPGTLSLRDDDLWARLDHDFHDFDLLTKETALTVRDFIGCLPVLALESFAAEVMPALKHGVRSCDRYRNA